MAKYIWPIPKGSPISQNFGTNPGGFNPSGGHTGTDFAVPLDTPVRAPAAGTIQYADWTHTANGSDNPWWLTTYGGICVVLDCGEVAFVFAHLNSTGMNVGDQVNQGDIIAYSGNTGTATSGPHLHFESLPDGWNFYNGTYGRVDPANYCSGYYEDSVVSLNPNQRKVGQYGVKGRTTASTSGTIQQTFNPGDILDFKGFVHGENANGTDIWFVGAYSGLYFSASAFDDGSTNGLSDLTTPAPANNLQPNQRVVGVDTANYRDAPRLNANVLQTFKKGDVLNLSSYVHGDVVSGTDVWFKGQFSNGYISASVFDDSSTNGIPADNPAPSPTPEPPAPSTGSRTSGSAVLNIRKLPFLNGETVAQLAANSAVTPIGFTHGDSIENNDVWFSIDKGWVWSGGFDDSSTTGLQELPVPGKPTNPVYTGLNGIDISSFQKGINLSAVPGQFVWIKASEGVNWSDPELANNIASARKAGKLVGFYHYARPLADSGNTAQAESDSFLKFVIPLLQAGDRLALDWEAENQQNTAWAKEWLDRVYAATGVRSAFYANFSSLNAYDWTFVAKDYPLWLAQYPTSVAQGYGPVATHGDVKSYWTLDSWQYSDKGQIDGFAGALDLDIFFGTAQDWVGKGYKVPAPQPSPVPTPTPTPEPTPAPDEDKRATLIAFVTKQVDDYLAGK